MATWTTDAIDARIRELRSQNVSHTGIIPFLKAEFGIKTTKGMLVRRARTLRGVPGGHRGVPPPLTPWVGPLPAWGSEQANDLLRSDAAAKCHVETIARRWGVCSTTIWRQRRRLGLPIADPGPRLPAAVSCAARKHTPSEQQTRGTKDQSGRGGSVFWFRTYAPAVGGDVLVRTPGMCSWPLHCETPSAERYCAEHTGLLKRRAA